MRVICSGLIFACLLLSACTKPASGHDQKIRADKATDDIIEVAQNEQREMERSSPSPAATPKPLPDLRKVGPTNNGYFLVEATDGRKAELKFTDRLPDGTLKAVGLNQQKFEFPESRLTESSLAALHDFMTSNSMVNVRLEEVRSHTGKSTNRSSASAIGGARISTGTDNVLYRGARATHIVHVTTTSPFNREIQLETYYTDGDGNSVFGITKTKYTINNHEPVEITISAFSDTSVLQPVAIARNDEGEILDFEAKNPSIHNTLSTAR